MNVRRRCRVRSTVAGLTLRQSPYYNVRMSPSAQLIHIGNKSFSRGEISRQTGISLSHVSRIFSGGRAPSLKVLEKLTQFSGEGVVTVLQAIIAHSKASIEHKIAPASGN